MVKELTAKEEDIMLEEGREKHYERYDDDEKTQIANEVSEGQYEGYLRDSGESLKDRYIEEFKQKEYKAFLKNSKAEFIEKNQEDFDEWCREEYEMFKND